MTITNDVSSQPRTIEQFLHDPQPIGDILEPEILVEKLAVEEFLPITEPVFGTTPSIALEGTPVGSNSWRQEFSGNLNTNYHAFGIGRTVVSTLYTHGNEVVPEVNPQSFWGPLGYEYRLMHAARTGGIVLWCDSLEEPPGLDKLLSWHDMKARFRLVIGGNNSMAQALASRFDVEAQPSPEATVAALMAKILEPVPLRR